MPGRGHVYEDIVRDYSEFPRESIAEVLRSRPRSPTGTMWLLDVNLPSGLAPLLHSYGIACDTTARRGWRDLTNGELAHRAFREGFRVILTRDRLFGILPAGRCWTCRSLRS